MNGHIKKRGVVFADRCPLTKYPCGMYVYSSQVFRNYKFAGSVKTHVYRYNAGMTA